MKRKLKRLLSSMFALSLKFSTIPIRLLCKYDVKTGSTGYSVILTDSLAYSGRLDLALSLITRNVYELLERAEPRKTIRTGITGRLTGRYVRVSPSAKLETLKRINQGLENHNIRPFLAYGTLLGAIREQRFMPHDGDMDIGILTSEATAKTVKPIIENLGFQTKLLEQNDTDKWPCRLKVENQDGIIVDLVFFHFSENHLLTYCKYQNETLVRKRTPFNLRKSEFLGVEVWIPDPPEQFLNENYGNWQEPVKYYHHILSSPLTDHSLKVVKYCAKRMFYRLLTLGEYDKAQGLIDQMLERSEEKRFWMDISKKFNLFLLKR